ncbi:MAG: LysR family transcriptional regulator [Pseudoxanthomonas sp.]
MRFRQIEVFHAVYTTGSISAAARALYVSQPSVSKVLHHTQQQLGMELFRLVRGRLVATDEAHALFVEVSEVFDRLNSLRKAVGKLRNQAGSHIRLAVVPSLGLHLVPSAIARFRARHPDVTFEVHTLHYDGLFEALYERTADFALAYDAPSHPRLKRRDLDNAQLMLLFRRQELPDPPEAIRLRDLHGKDMVGLSAGGPLGDIFNRELQRQGVVVNEVVSNQTFYIAAALTRCGAGSSVVDEFTARANTDAETTFRPFSPPLRFKVQCVHLEDRPPSAVAERFLKLLTALVKEMRN